MLNKKDWWAVGAPGQDTLCLISPPTLFRSGLPNLLDRQLRPKRRRQVAAHTIARWQFNGLGSTYSNETVAKGVSGSYWLPDGRMVIGFLFANPLCELATHRPSNMTCGRPDRVTLNSLGIMNVRLITQSTSHVEWPPVLRQFVTTLRDPLLAPAFLFALSAHVAVLAIPALLSASAFAATGPNPWAHWDAVYYVRIATEGYLPYVRGPDHTGLAFLPLFPILLAAPARLGMPPYVTSMTIAGLSAVVAFGAFALLVTRDFGPRTAARSILLVAAMPAAAFLTLGYSESLFMALSISGFLLLRCHRWTAAAALFALAAITRPTGALLALPYLVEWMQTYRRAPRRGEQALAPLALVPLAMCAIGLYDASLGASPLAYLQVEHTAWHHYWAWPWTIMTQQLIALQHLPAAGISLLPIGVLNLLEAFLALPILAVCAWRLPLTYTVTALVMYVAATAAGSAAPFYGRDVTHPFVLPMISTHRYLIAAFPLPIAVALLVRRRLLLILVVALLVSLQMGVGAMFVTRLWAG